MANLPDLGKQIGPLPLGAWIGVVAGGLGLAWYINRRGGGGTTSTPTDDGTGTSGDVGSGAGGGQMIYDPPQGGPSTPTGYETNDQWGRAAILHLLSEGKDPAESTLAISRYLGEYSLTAAQQALVSLAIKKLGPPPQLPSNPPDPPVTNPPVTPPTNPPVTPALTAPKNVRTWGNGASRLTVPLTWDAVPGATGYRVYRKGVATNIGHSVDTKITLGGLKPNTSYTFHVRAMQGGKTGPSSVAKTVKTKK